MRAVLALAALVAPVAALPAPILIAGPDTEGAFVTLHDEAGPCEDSARLAVYQQGKKTIRGCWVAVPGGIMVSFLDGQRGDIPAAHFRKVKDT